MYELDLPPDFIEVDEPNPGRLMRIAGGAAAMAVLAAATACGGSEASVEDARCDLGFNTEAFNEANEHLVEHPEHAHLHDHTTDEGVSFTLLGWAQTFTDEALGLTPQDVVDELETPDKDIDKRQILAGVLTHTLQPDQWLPMTDQAQCEALAEELQAAHETAAKYPTVADALADGYTLGDWYNAGLGVHYQDYGRLGPFDPAHPLQLLYDGTEPDSHLVGLSYVLTSPDDTPPEGFTGSNDQWHKHRSWCLDADGINRAADVVDQTECEQDMHGTYIANTNLWMLHLWVVPGCESQWGIFSGANPALPYLPEGATFVQGCNTGKAVTEPLQLDHPDNGPSIAKLPLATSAS